VKNGNYKDPYLHFETSVAIVTDGDNETNGLVAHTVGFKLEQR
jgi:hypothetical protein